MSPVVLAFAVLAEVTFAPAELQGRVVAAPHDGYDRHSGSIAREVSRELGWGWVIASRYRSRTNREWFDVNRPTERPWLGDDFGTARLTWDAWEIHEEYLRKLRQAGRVSGRLDLLVEIHGHARRVNTSSGTLRVQAIELATTGFSSRQLRELQELYDRYMDYLPESWRVPLAVDRLDRYYVAEGWWVPFYYYASGAKREGSLRSENSERALHFELPPAVRDDADRRSVYAWIIARLIEQVAPEDDE